jgi:NTE family protein
MRQVTSNFDPCHYPKGILPVSAIKRNFVQEVTTSIMQKTPIILSGGGARGFAHVGVLQALSESGITPSAIAATSAGALVGAFIADGFHPSEVKDLVLKNVHLGYLFDFKNMRSKLISLHKIGEFIRKNLRHNRMEDLPIPFYAAATNYIDGTQHIFSSGDIVEAILAASSIPGIFSPVMINGIPYVDGGLYSNLPIEPFAQNKKEVIAVHVNPIAPFDAKSSVARTIDRAFHLSILHRVKAVEAECRLLIEPYELHQFGLFDVHKLQDIYDVGYAEVKRLMA